MERGSVEENLNELLEAEAEKLTQVARYECNEQCQGYRRGRYNRNLITISMDVALKVPKLNGISFETAIIEQYRCRESNVEEALIEVYLAGLSVRRVENITEALWGSKVTPSTISELNKKACVRIEDWRNCPLQGGRHPYVYVYGSTCATTGVESLKMWPFWWQLRSKNYGDPDVSKAAYPKFLEKLEGCRDLFHGFDYTAFLSGDDLEKARMISGGVNFLLGKSVAEHDLPEKERTQSVYVKEALLLKQALSLCGSLVDSKTRLEAAYFEAVRTMLVRLATGGTGKKFTLPEVNEHINELLKHSIQSEGVINLFSDVGTEFSLFDSKFLEEISRMKEKNLAVELLKKLIAEQISIYRRTNVVKSEKFSEIIQSAMNRYLNGMLTNEEVIEELLKLAKDIAAANAEGEKLGLTTQAVSN